MAAAPAETIAFLSEFIEYSEPTDTVLVRDLLSDIQVQTARLRGTLSAIGRDDKMITRDNLEDYIIDTGCIYARAPAAFDFFRGRSDSLPAYVTWDNVKSSLRQMDFYENSFTDLYEKIDRWAEKSPDPKRWS